MHPCLILVFMITLLPTTTDLAQTPQSAILGKFIPAIIKCFGKKLTGVNMNKVNHIIKKVQHGLDVLDPAEIVYEVVHIVAHQLPSTKIVQVVLTSGKVVHLMVRLLSGGGIGLGTGYLVERISEEIEDVC
ncbi:unnamed protein product [Rotaria magnacalcarata]|uniref:Uncharacterized protein n=1 Tax=Rotaria magnacalcarata TaxID=392030 RepID=A0A820PNL5_9BILA|nr:unnamed protein product [Rotaria magnacalcarata]CAF2091312.1 unnamed protein product [Rotaria magnacalcarata]CAF4055201.1 unnamed protein product [Rotaria magnacalcarata]CAF4408711.1 unnamed protein product [Rotaria magnacalcarata]